MKTQTVLTYICLLAMSVAAIGCGQQNDRENRGEASQMSAAAPPPTNQSVTLISRYTGGNYLSATYSFRFLTQGDVAKTRNNWEILFEAREDFEDYFRVNTVVDDNSFIYDLGERSCKDIKSTVPDDRKNRPLVWLAYSDASPSGLEPAQTAKVQVGHCYLTYNNDEDGRVVALFHVQSHEKNKTVTIDEIEVLDVLTRD